MVIERSYAPFDLRSSPVVGAPHLKPLNRTSKNFVFTGNEDILFRCEYLQEILIPILGRGNMSYFFLIFYCF